MSGEILAIVGCRQYDDFDYFCQVVDKYIAHHKLTIQSIWSGGAPGIDDMAEDYAKLRGYAFVCVEADWDKHGPVAGFIRNEELINQVSSVLAFWDNKSTGTRDAVDRALRKRKFTTTVPIKTTERRYYCARKRALYKKKNAERASNENSYEHQDAA